jgi:hypothetical protein
VLAGFGLPRAAFAAGRSGRRPGAWGGYDCANTTPWQFQVPLNFGLA